jgi:hypothetical protein
LIRQKRLLCICIQKHMSEGISGDSYSIEKIARRFSFPFSFPSQEPWI